MALGGIFREDHQVHGPAVQPSCPPTSRQSCGALSSTSALVCKSRHLVVDDRDADCVVAAGKCHREALGPPSVLSLSSTTNKDRTSMADHPWPRSRKALFAPFSGFLDEPGRFLVEQHPQPGLCDALYSPTVLGRVWRCARLWRGLCADPPTCRRKFGALKIARAATSFRTSDNLAEASHSDNRTHVRERAASHRKR